MYEWRLLLQNLSYVVSYLLQHSHKRAYRIYNVETSVDSLNRNKLITVNILLDRYLYKDSLNCGKSIKINEQKDVG